MNSPRILPRVTGTNGADGRGRTLSSNPGRWRSADELHPHERTSAWAPLRQSKAPVRVDCATLESLRAAVQFAQLSLIKFFCWVAAIQEALGAATRAKFL